MLLVLNISYLDELSCPRAIQDSGLPGIGDVGTSAGLRQDSQPKSETRPNRSATVMCEAVL